MRCCEPEDFDNNIDVVNGVDIYVYSDIEQVVEFDQNLRFNILSAKNGDISFCGCSCQIRTTGTYRLDFASDTIEHIPLALTVNHCVVPGVVYVNFAAENIGEIIVDLKRGDRVALTNKFSFEPLALKENVISTIRVANASLSIIRL